MGKPVDHAPSESKRDTLHFAPGIALSAALAALAMGFASLKWLQSYGWCTNRLF
jgi:hypothetical protein